MIKKTDGEKHFIIKESELWNRNKDLIGKATKLKYPYWAIELLFIEEEDGIYQKIVKCYPDGDDYLNKYVNLDKTKKDYILLNKKDYQEVEMMYLNMNAKKDYKKEMLIEVGSQIYSYEYYQHFILELGTREEMSEEEIYALYVENVFSGISKYKKEILEKAKEKLKDIYKVNVDYLGGEQYA